MIRLKNDVQIAGIRKSCRLLADMYTSVIPQVAAGISTKDVDDLCAEFITRHGGTPAWYREDFPGAACISINDEVIHGIPSRKRKIHDGDLVSLDVGIDLDGYISDSAVTVMVGNVKPEYRRLVEVTRECLAAGIAACKAGNRISDISKAVFAVADAAGYGVVYEYCGHGVGLDVHEDPSIPNVVSRGPNPRIQPGMVLAIEPMINLGCADVELADDGWTVLSADGKVSAHEEHTVAVFRDHTEILTLRG
ncbi:type I methionyl aminopeptidase [Treponema brennaborense]|uniref:Methionine aminopeptidase n=1 Tax=Treponema brennaborense (strain DSM 12168 / CIP 105900 / DD5/3) TaxID=906968 RepID=F4LQ36_TREBD|nr:type I methionyl aminopeptidase [Treponema brennaborense]AEE17114.1 methionine aminopeptidase, type I [Treponema brennaborense DSM 12168]